MQPSRVEQTAPVCKSNGKWACTFQVIRTGPDGEYVAGELETAGVWFDEASARAAGERALQTLAETDRFPNMCEVW